MTPEPPALVCLPGALLALFPEAPRAFATHAATVGALMDEIERELGMSVVPFTWPVGMGKLFGGVVDLRIVGSGRDQSRQRDGEVLARASRRREAALDGGQGDLAQVALGGEGVGQQAVGHFARHLGHQGTHGRQEDLGVPVGVR